jgi:hypothetical protein
MQNKSKVVLTAILFLLILSASSPALANHGQFSVTVKNPDPSTGNQSWFIYTKNPGETVEDYATVINFSSDPLTLRAYAVDATSSSSGSFVLKFQDEKQKGIGSWTTIEPSEFTVQPNERKDLKFTVKIPADASPGEQVGGIIVENSAHQSDNAKANCPDDQICGGSISVKTRIGARVYLNIPGEIKEDIHWTVFNVEQNWTGVPHFHFRIENKGNVSYQPVAHLEISDMIGNIVDTFDTSLGDSLPDTVIEPTIVWPKTPFIGQFAVKASVTFPQRFSTATGMHGASAEEFKTVNFWVIPWLIVIIFSAVMLGGGSAGICCHLRFKKMIRRSDQYEVQDNEDLITISKNNNISWKKLAKINDMKPPYIIRKGQFIRIPKNKKKE